MTTVLTEKQEAFAFAFVECGVAADAYRQAYDASKMSAAAIHREAHALRTNPKIAARIEELRAEARQEHRVTFDRVIQELAAIALHDPADYFEKAADDVSIKDLLALPPEQRRVIKSLTQTTTQHGGTTKLVFHDKLAAMETLSRLLGYFDKDNKQKAEALGQAAGEAASKVWSDLEAARAMAFILERGRQEKLAAAAAQPAAPAETNPNVDNPA